MLSFKSPAEFFSENKNIAGFDNVGKYARPRAERPPIRHVPHRTPPPRTHCTARARHSRRSLYTTVRELVENSLDACESIRALPDIEIALEEMDTAGLNRLMGVVTHERIDESLFERVRGRSRTPTASTAARLPSLTSDAACGRRARRRRLQRASPQQRRRVAHMCRPRRR